MQDQVVEIKIKVDADTKKITILNNSLKEVSSTSIKTTKGITNIGERLKDLAKNATFVYGAFSGLRASFLSLSSPISYFIKNADEFNLLHSRLGLVINDTKELKNVESALIEVANKSGASFSDTAELFNDLSIATKDLGKSTYETMKMVDTISKALVISGTDATSAKMAIMRLGESFINGSFSGEELNGMLRKTPRLATAIADGLNMSIKELREFAKTGQISATQIYEALQKSATKIDEESSKISLTVSKAFAKLKNNYEDLLVSLNDTSGATNELALFIDNFADGLAKNGQNIVIFFNNLIRSFELMGEAVIYTATTIYEGILAIPTSIALGIDILSKKISDLLNSLVNSALPIINNIRTAIGKTAIDIKNIDLSTNLSENLTKHFIDVSQIKDNAKSAFFNILNEFETYTSYVSNSSNSNLDKLSKKANKSLIINTKNSLKDNLKEYEYYFKSIGDLNKAWEFKAKQIKNEFSGKIKNNQINELLTIEKKKYFELDKKEQTRIENSKKIGEETLKIKLNEFEFERHLLDLEIDEYKKTGVSKNEIDAYVSAKALQINKKQNDKELELLKHKQDKQKEANLKQLEYYKNYYDLLGQKSKAAFYETKMQDLNLRDSGASNEDISNALYGNRQKKDNYNNLYEGDDMGGTSKFIQRLQKIEEFNEIEADRINEHYALLEQNKEAHEAKMNELEKARFQSSIATAGVGFDAMTSLANSFYILSGKKNKTFLRAYQTAMVGKAIVNTYTSATNAMATAGNPYLGAALAAVAIVAGLAQVAQIKAQTFHTGGFVYGNGEVPAILQSGEGVLSRKGMSNLDRLNMGSDNETKTQDITIINTLDPSVFESFATSRSGRRLILNIVREE